MLKARSLFSLLCILILSYAAYFYINKVKPPMSSPDEILHFARADALSNGDLLLQSPEGIRSGQYLDAAYQFFLTPALINENNVDENIIFERPKTFYELEWAGKTKFFSISSTAFYFPLIYTPHALAIKFGKLINLNFSETYNLVRLFTFLSCVMIIIAAWVVYPIPLVALAILFMPMTIFQLMSPTLDGMATALTILCMSLFVSLIKDNNSNTENSKLLLLSICIFLLASSRANLIFICFIPALVYFKNKSWKYLASSCVLFLFVIAWTLYAIHSVQDGGVNHPGFTQSQVMLHYVTHPFELLKIIFATITSSEFLVSYVKQYIGILGLLNVPLPSWYYKFVIVTTAIIFCASSRALYIDYNRNLIIYLSVISLASTVLIFCALLVQYSPFPAETVYGVQGRYFIIPSIMLSYIFANRNQPEKVSIGLVLAIAISSVFIIHELLYAHYKLLF
ncbi:DUF2142 domain-containing protein [Buttiauxella sp. WJP83]|uniref:DUF2142 domain-containing protein n=1 Tax=Buttiauxella sp. WJP83 TaxID=2986951 RepID=UPI0022DCFFD0|nr:DUF2142 domain-containing protein [Buttiauxella sp. WJP83]WBM72087.1 DUF2142 domain-containing protein [Buttiauxella sp. WJP83]